jgi:FAD binding domain-containing protein
MTGSENNEKKIPRNTLDPEIYKELEEIVGPLYISEDRAIVETYSKYSIDPVGFLKKHGKDGSNIPACIVLPHTAEEIQSIVKLLNRHRVPFSPFTNGQILCGPTTPAPTVLMHLSRMNRFIEIDEDNMTMTVDPFVDYTQIQAEAMKRGLWNGGSPLSTCLCKMASHFAIAGIWQTDLKYGSLSRNVVGVEMVMPTGEILKIGSPTNPAAEPFYDYGPGPDIHGLLRSSFATTGIVTRITIKLHTWVGDRILKTPEKKPHIHDWQDFEYERAEVPKNHRLIWVDCPDLDTQMEILSRTCHAGVGIGLNSAGVYSSFYCAPTQELTEKWQKEKFFPAYNVYFVTAGVTSEKQLDYEEKVFRHIVDEAGGCKYLGPDHKPEVFAVLSTWNLDFVRNQFGYRMNRRMYASAWVLGGDTDIPGIHQENWQTALDHYQPLSLADTGGGKDDTPFVYCQNRGHYTLTETDNYPDPLSPPQLATAVDYMIYGAALLTKKKAAPYAFAGLPFEPFTTFFPEVGPNTNIFLRKVRRVFDPVSVAAPGRQVFLEEELEMFPGPMADHINSIRALHDLEPVKIGKGE